MFATPFNFLHTTASGIIKCILKNQIASSLLSEKNLEKIFFDSMVEVIKFIKIKIKNKKTSYP